MLYGVLKAVFFHRLFAYGTTNSDFEAAQNENIYVINYSYKIFSQMRIYLKSCFAFFFIKRYWRYDYSIRKEEKVLLFEIVHGVIWSSDTNTNKKSLTFQFFYCHHPTQKDLPFEFSCSVHELGWNVLMSYRSQRLAYV